MSRRRKLLLATGIVGVLIGAGLLLLPEIVRRVAVARLSDVVAAPVSIEDVDLNLFAGSAAVSNLVIGETAQEQHPLVRWSELHVDFAPLALFRGTLRVHSLTVQEPRLHLVRTAPASFNILEVLRLPQQNDGPGPALDLVVDQAAVRNGTIVFVDRTVTPNFERTLADVTFRAGPISLPRDIEVTPTSFSANFAVGGGSIAIEGKATPLARPGGIQAEARWKNLELPIFTAYLPSSPQLDLSGGVSSGELQYVLAHAPMKHYVTASFNAGPAAIYAPDSEQPISRIVNVQVRGARWDVVENQGSAEEVALERPYFRVERHADGAFTISKLFNGESQSSAENADDSSPDTAGLPFTIGHLHTRQGTIDVADRYINPNVTGTFENVELEAKRLNLAGGAEPGTVTAEAQLGSSPVRIDGTLQPFPFSTRLQITSKSLPMEAYEGYLRPIWPEVRDWAGNLSGQVELTLTSHDNGLGVDVSGKLAATELALGFSEKGRPPLRAQKLELQLASLRTYPSFVVDIARVHLAGAQLRIRRSQDGTFNLSPIWSEDEKASSQTQASPEAEQTGTSEPSFVIQRAAAKDSSIYFLDGTVKPPFQTTFTDVDIEMGKLGRQSGMTPITIQANVEESARLELKGSIRPFEDPLRIKLSGVLRDYNMSELNPYATKFIQYEIARGRVTTDVEYSYDAGDLDGQNQITIRRFQLGDRLGDEFQNRIGISLRLAVALLQGADGTIRLAIPVSGNLTDPQFDWGGIIWRAVRNAVVSFISAPLRLLGNVVTLGGKINRVRLEPVEFEPGSTDLKANGKEQLDELTQLLKNKPKIELEVRGLASREELAALKRRRLKARIGATGEAYQTALARLYRLSSRDGKNGPLPSVSEMEGYLAEKFAVSDTALQNLARERASFVIERMAEAGVETGRLFTDSGIAERLPGRVEFELLA